MKTIKILSVFLLAVTLFASCDKDEMKKEGNITLDIQGLSDLGSDYAYEGWIMVDGAPVTTGVFTVDSKGKLSKNSFTLTEEQAGKATAFILTIEPMPDADPAPSKVHILAGDVSASKAMLTVGHGAALKTDFATSKGKYILATPTNDDNTDEKSGVWFLDNSSGMPAAGLTLPTLPEGWIYEGWAVTNGKAVTTGKFTKANMKDAMSPFSGTKSGPGFPGEDFLVHAPAGLTFPTDLSGGKIVISVEPVPDNSPAPFLLKPLLGTVPTDAMGHKVYMLDNIAAKNNPTGSVSLSIK